MTAIGADPDALDALASALSGASGELDRSARRIDVALGRSGWSGPDAERFRRSWSAAHRGRLQERAAALRTLGRQVRHQAAEQRRASFSSFGATAATRFEPLPDATVIDGKLTGSVKLLAGSLQGTLTIEEVGDRRQVTYSRQVGLGVDASTGSGVEVHTGDMRAGEGATAGASAFVEGVQSETYSVDADHLALLVAGLAAREGVRTLPVALPGASRIVDRAVGAALGDPIRTEQLIGVEGAAGGWAATGSWVGPALATSISSQTRVGVAEADGARTLVMEAEGDVAAALVGTPAAARELASSDHAETGIADVLGLGQHSVDAAWSVRIEAPLDDGSELPILVTATSTGGDDRVITRIAIDPSAAGIAALQVSAALDAARSGDVGGAVRALRSLRLPDGSYDVDFTTVALDRRDVGGSLITPVPGVSVDGSITDLDAPD